MIFIQILLLPDVRGNLKIFRMKTYFKYKNNFFYNNKLVLMNDEYFMQCDLFFTISMITLIS